MSYLFHSNMQHLLQSFNQDWMLTPVQNSTENITLDLSKTPFLGTNEAARIYVNIWRSIDSRCDFYYSGNMTASNLSFLLPEGDESNYRIYSFALLSDANEPTALSFMYKEDVTSQWLFVSVKNPHLAPERREVTLFSATSFHGIECNACDNVTGFKQFLNYTNSQILKNMLPILSAANPANTRISRILLLLRSICLTQPNPFIEDPIPFFRFNANALFAPNFCLDLLVKYQIQVSAYILWQCCVPDSLIHTKIAAITLGSDYRLNKNKLQLSIALLESNCLEDNRELLENDGIIQEFGALLENKIQIQLLPVLIKRKYDIEFIKLILLEAPYCNSVKIMAELGILQNVPAFFKVPEKLVLLRKIDALTDSVVKKICLTFWAKGDFSETEINNLVLSSQKYPLLAETLLALDQTHTISLTDLKNLAQNPQKHLRKSLQHHYSLEFKDYNLDKKLLKRLNSSALEHLRLSFKTLKESPISKPDYYQLALQSNSDGELLRLFLPQVSTTAHRDELINILFIGVKKGLVNQGQAILHCNDPHLRDEADALRERFVCVRQMQHLLPASRFKKEMIALAAEPDGIKGRCFRRIILSVEEQCKTIHEQLRKSKSEYNMVGKWQKAEEEYRREIYAIAFQGITKPGPNLSKRLQQAERSVLEIVDPQTTPLIVDILIVIANILITTLTLSIANDIKFRKTGNYWFFNQSSAGEKIRALDNKVIHLIDAAAPTLTA